MHARSYICVVALQAAVAVRSAPGISTLKDVALLTGGDTFGELALLVSLQLLMHTIQDGKALATSATSSWQAPRRHAAPTLGP